MGNKASTTDIVTFLQKVKRLITTGKYDFVPRRKKHASTCSAWTYYHRC